MFGQGFSFSGYERDPLFLNLGNRKFVDISGCSGIDSVSDGRAGVFADFDNDGDLDVFSTTIQGQSHLLFRNNVGQDSRLLRVALEGGKSIGRDAWSAVVRVRTSAGTLTKTKAGGSGFISQHDPRLLFGLGTDESADSVEVTWPDGTVEPFAGPFAAGTTVRLVQGKGRAEPVRLAAARLPDPLTRSRRDRLRSAREGGRAPARPEGRGPRRPPGHAAVPGEARPPPARQRVGDLVRPLQEGDAGARGPAGAARGPRGRPRRRQRRHGEGRPGRRLRPVARDLPRLPHRPGRPGAALQDRRGHGAALLPPREDGRVAELIPGWSDASRRRFEQILGGGGPAAGR